MTNVTIITSGHQKMDINTGEIINTLTFSKDFDRLKPAFNWVLSNWQHCQKRKVKMQVNGQDAEEWLQEQRDRARQATKPAYKEVDPADPIKPRIQQAVRPHKEAEAQATGHWTDAESAAAIEECLQKAGKAKRGPGITLTRLSNWHDRDVEDYIFVWPDGEYIWSVDMNDNHGWDKSDDYAVFQVFATDERDYYDTDKMDAAVAGVLNQV